MVRKISDSRGCNWNYLTGFFNYPKDIRRGICMTKAIESLNFSLRKVTKSKSSFPDDDTICNVRYLAIKNSCTCWTYVNQKLGDGGQPVCDIV